MTQNIRSIYKNIDEFNVFIQRLDIACDIIVLTECWLSKTNDNLPVLPGYCSYKSTITYNQNDGVVVYFKKLLKITVEVKELQDCNCLIIKNGSDQAIICIYRPPSFKNLDPFYKSLDDTLKSLAPYKSIILIGDLNINIKPECNDIKSQSYLNLCSYHGLLPSHTSSTHQSGSCLDHIMLKTSLSSLTLITNSTITDHYAVILTLNLSLPQQNHNQYTRSKLNMCKLERDLCCIDYDPVYKNDDVNVSTLYLINKVQSAILKNTQITRINSKLYNIKPWITPGLVRCIRHRDKLHKTAKKYPNNHIHQIIYKRYRNFCNDILKKVKINYDKNELHKAGKNCKLLWKHIKKVTFTSKQRESSSSLLLSHCSPITSANYVNNFFVNVGKNLANKLSKNETQTTIPRQSHNKFLQSFVLLDTDESEVEKLILGLKDDCAVGWDNISNVILKKFRHILGPPLTHIFGICLAKGIFPNCLKKAVVIPIFKSGSKSLVNNYRPISLLPAISKILEKIINNRLINYLEKKSLLSNMQFGFRPKLSAPDAVFHLTEYVTQELGKGKKTIGIFCDLTKAFDTVSIPNLLCKLESLGIRGIQLKLLADYLSNRSQCVKINDTISEDKLIESFGVPQGSILGPTLFLIYINDLCNLKLENGKVISYADDTALVFSGDSRKEAYEYAQKGFNTVNNWFQANLLTLNTSKTKLVNFCMRRTNEQDYQLIKAHYCMNQTRNPCNCPQIHSTNSIKYLGVVLDETLCFEEHISTLVARVRKLMFVFKKIRYIADSVLIIQIYQALCQSIIQYGITSYGGAPKTLLISLERAQRAILKVATRRPFLFPTQLLYKSCNVLTVRQLFIMYIILKQHSAYNPGTNPTNKRRKDIVCFLSFNIETHLHQ